MRIDNNVEQRVRDALHWVVKQKPDEFDAALKKFPDEPSRLNAIELLLKVCALATVDVFGRKPTSDEITALASKIAETEAWSSVTGAEVESFLELALTRSQPTKELPAQSVPILAFVAAGNLLASKPLPEGEWWFDYLDKLESIIESSV